MTAIPNSGYYFINWTDDNNSDSEVATTAAYTHTVGTAAAAFTAHFGKYPVITFSKGESGAEGTVRPATFTTTGSYVIPTNNGLYVAGKTLTKWTDGVNEYAIGETISSITSDITLTPIFTTNAFSLEEIPETEVEFNFTQNGGAPIMKAEGSSLPSTMRVTQATVGTQFVDVLMSVDASAGKFNNNQGNLDACQINATTVISIPAVKGMTVKLNAEVSTSYLGESTNVGVVSSGTTTWTYSGVTGGTVDLTLDNSNFATLMTVTYPGATIPVTIASSGFSSFSSTMALDLAHLPTGLKAYQIKASDVGAKSIKMTEVTEAVPAATGLILYGTPGTEYAIPVAATGTTLSENKLVAATEDTPIGGDGVYDYILKDGKFYHASAGTIAAGKAYLHLDAAPAAREFSIIFDDDNTTAIEAVKAQKTENGEYFNLNGQRVAQPTKGLYIVNGKKVIIK